MGKGGARAGGQEYRHEIPVDRREVSHPEALRDHHGIDHVTRRIRKAEDDHEHLEKARCRKHQQDERGEGQQPEVEEKCRTRRQSVCERPHGDLAHETHPDRGTEIGRGNLAVDPGVGEENDEEIQDRKEVEEEPEQCEEQNPERPRAQGLDPGHGNIVAIRHETSIPAGSIGNGKFGSR